jgi:hypothetical protein
VEPTFIIEVTDEGKPAFVTEHEGELYLTRRREEAARYPKKLDAMCALVYLPEGYRPRLVQEQ